MRVVRRLERRPTRLFFGEPRLVLIDGWVGTEDVRGFSEAETGLEQRAEDDGVGTASVFRMNFETFLGVPSRFLERLVGESKSAGSTFSLSSSSSKADEAVWRRFDGENFSCLPSGDEKQNEDEAMATEG